MTPVAPATICREFGIIPAFELPLHRAEEQFQIAAEGNEPAGHIALGLRFFLAGVAVGDLRIGQQRPAGLLPAFWGAVFTVQRAVDAVLAAQLKEAAIILAEQVEFESIDDVDADLVLEGLDRLALLADELDAAHRRARIAARGAPRARRDAIDRAALAEPAGLLN